jgi:hypothetical protein
MLRAYELADLKEDPVRTTTISQILLASLLVGSNSASAQSVKSIRATVPPKQETPVAFETFPNAVCTFHRTQQDGTRSHT